MPTSERAARLHRESIVIDACVRYLLRRTDRTDRSGLTAVALTIPMPNEDAGQTYPRVRDFLEVIHAESTFCLADSPAAIRRAKAEGKMAHILLSQDSLFLGADPASLLLWKQLGLRICQLTYNEKNLIGDGCLERHDGGLSQLGRVMVREMERVGITIDPTHAGKRTFLDACGVATKPLIASVPSRLTSPYQQRHDTRQGSDAGDCHGTRRRVSVNVRNEWVIGPHVACHPRVVERASVVPARVFGHTLFRVFEEHWRGQQYTEQRQTSGGLSWRRHDEPSPVSQ